MKIMQIAAGALALALTAGGAAAPSLRDRIVGTWDFVVAEVTAPDGRKSYPFGETPKGSRHFLRHQDGRTTLVPVHAGETIDPGLLSKILRDCELAREELQKLL
jgi:hypothetical protein